MATSKILRCLLSDRSPERRQKMKIFAQTIVLATLLIHAAATATTTSTLLDLIEKQNTMIAKQSAMIASLQTRVSTLEQHHETETDRRRLLGPGAAWTRRSARRRGRTATTRTAMGVGIAAVESRSRLLFLVLVEGES